MNIYQYVDGPQKRLPVNRVLFFSPDQQKQFTVWVFHIILFFIFGFFVLDVVAYLNDSLTYNTAFWIRQAASILILAHGLWIHNRFSSGILFSMAVLLNATILFLVFFSNFFPVNSFIILAVVPTAIVSVFYDRRVSQYFLLASCVAVVSGILLVFGADQIWNAVLVAIIFIIVSLVIYLQNPSIQLLKAINEVRSSQYAAMLRLVYDGIAVCQENRIVDADEGFYTLFKIPTEYRQQIYLMDILSSDAQQTLFATLHQQDSVMLKTQGKKFDGSLLPIEINAVQRKINRHTFLILAVHDASQRLDAEFALQRKNVELLMINRISQMVNSSLSLGEVLSTILEEIQTIYQNRSSSVWLLEEKFEEFICVNAKGVFASQKIGKHVSIHSGLFSQMMETGEPIFIENLRDDPLQLRVKNLGHGFEVQTILILPIYYQEKLIGLLQFLDDRVNSLKKSDIEVLQSIAANSSVAIRNARQFEQLANDQQRWRILQLISQRINACLQPKEIYRAITDNIRDILPFDYFIIGLLNEQDGGYDIVHIVGTEEESAQVYIEKGEGLIGHVIERNQSLLIDDFPETYADKVKVRYLRHENLQSRSVLAVPLVRGNRSIGMLSAQSYQPSVYKPADVQMLELIAAHSVIALDNARHYQEALESARLRDTIYLIGQEINSRLNPDQVYETIFRAVEKVIPMDFMFISSVDHEEGLQHFRFFKDKTVDMVEAPFSSSIDNGISGYVIKTGKSLRTGDFTQLKIDGYESIHLGAPDHVTHSLLFVPMIRGKLVTGVLSVQSRSKHMFTAYHQTMLELIAPYAASALENAWLFSKIEALATTDELSGVNNRHHFNHALKQEFERSKRYHRPLSLIIIDIDNFKEINDLYGHLHGDEVIRQYGTLLRENIRESDIAARFGGDEFAVIMPETTADQALNVAHKIEQLCCNAPLQFSRDSIQVSMSIGLAELDIRLDRKPEDLIHKADNAMYQAKSEGRSRTVLFSG